MSELTNLAAKQKLSLKWDISENKHGAADGAAHKDGRAPDKFVCEIVLGGQRLRGTGGSKKEAKSNAAAAALSAGLAHKQNGAGGTQNGGGGGGGRKRRGGR